MEGTHNDRPSADPPMTPIERQMQVIATSIQDLAWETTRQNKELWHAIKKRPPTLHNDNQRPPQRENRLDDQEVDSRQVTRCRDDEVEKTPPFSRHRAESAGSSAPPSHQKTDRTARSSKQPDRLNNPIVQIGHPNNPTVQPNHPEGRTIKRLVWKRNYTK
jgi:hypothetical protein